MWKPLLPEGVSSVERSNRLALHCADTLKAVGSLKEMTADWMFFTIGCIYTYGGLDRDVIAEYTQTHRDPDCIVMTLHSGRPIFTGMCPPGWPDKTRKLEHELCAAPLEYWDELRDRICQIGMVDRRRGRYAQTLIQEIEIVDHVAVDNATVAAPTAPTVPIVAFGVDGTHYHVVLMVRTDPGPYDTARVVKLPIREQTRKVGKAILAHDPQPLVASLELTPADPADVARKIQEAKEKTE